MIGFRIIDRIVEYHVDVVVREAGKAKTCILVTRVIRRVLRMEEVVHAGEPLVDVLRRVVDTMVVVPECVHRLSNVTRTGMGGIDTGQHVRVVVVVEFTAGVEEAWEAIRFRRSVSVV